MTSKTATKTLLFNAGDEILLPQLMATHKLSIGEIKQQLRSESREKIASLESFKLSPRITETIFQLETGERFVITERKKCVCPMGVDGVLRVDQNKNLNWVSHSALERFKETVEQEDGNDWRQYRQGITAGWKNIVKFQAERLDETGDVVSPGLRPAQLGALHNIVGHWVMSTDPGTVVMPTGTGKTEVMLATSLQVADEHATLVVVPTNPLRDQTVRKYLTLGLMRDLGVVPTNTRNPIVGIIRKRPKSLKDLDIFERCHVVIANVASLSQGTALPLLPEMTKRTSTLIIDEAHHVAAKTWMELRKSFVGRRIMQLSATPFRRDGKLVDGKVVFSYSLRQAQSDGFFRAVEFKPVFEYEQSDAGEAIAKSAISQLKEDLTDGYEHIIMARCNSVERAKEIAKIYHRLAPEYEPCLVHSQMGRQSAENMNSVRALDSRIVVCVDMLGEGFDLPNLKIAAVHDTHKSIAVLLQFCGRFTRSCGEAIGTATMIANIANQDVSDSLERLYQEDADWNHLLSEFSSEAAKSHRELVDFLNESKRLDSDETTNVEISQNLLRPKCSGTVFRCEKFQPKNFYNAISKDVSVQACWLHEASNTLYFATRRESKVDWSRSKEIRDVTWDLFVLHYDSRNKLLFIGASDKSSLHEKIANAVGDDAAVLLRGDDVFRTLGHINRLRFQQIGVKKAGRRNLSYAMYTGSDVRTALSAAQKAGSYKSNLAGSGFANGEPVTIGCSYKGRVWSKDKGTVRTFINWCQTIGDKLVDQSIDTSAIIDNVLVPEEIFSLPKDTSILSVDWPEEIWRQSFDRVILFRDGDKTDLSFVDLEYVRTNLPASEIDFRVKSADWSNEYTLFVGGENGFSVSLKSGTECDVKAGRLGPMPLAEYFRSYPPLFLLSDLSEINGNLWVRPNEKASLDIPCLLYTSPSPRDLSTSRMPSSA